MTSGRLAPHQRERIEDFLLAYVHCIDEDELERWPQYFTTDATYQIITREGYEAGQRLGIMLCRGQGMMVDRVRAMREANVFEPQRYTHVLGRPQFSCNGEALLCARSNFLVVRTMQNGDSETFASGKYLDVLLLEESQVLLKERRVVLDSRRVDTLLVVPI